MKAYEKSIENRHGVVDVPYVFLDANGGLLAEASCLVKVPFRQADITFIANSPTCVYAVDGHKATNLPDIILAEGEEVSQPTSQGRQTLLLSYAVGLYEVQGHLRDCCLYCVLYDDAQNYLVVFVSHVEKEICIL